MAGIFKFKVAHVKSQGVDLILVPLASSFGQMKRIDQEKTFQTLQHYAAASGLRGYVVPIWDRGAGKAEFLAEKQLLPILQHISLAVVQQNLNRELSIKGSSLGALPGLLGHPDPEEIKSEGPAKTGTIRVSCDVDDAQVFLDGAFVGNVGGRVGVTPGPHVVEVRSPGYETWKQEVQAAGGSEIQLRASLEVEAVCDGFESEDFEAARDQRGKVAAFQRKHRIGLVTLMFTDTVGSTKMKQELGDRDAVKLIQGHHREVRMLLKTFPGGEEISTAGDSFFIVFAKPSDAVKFGLQFQARLRSLSQGSSFALRDRIGIHVGEVFIEEVAGSNEMNDLYGIQVDTAARVMSLADGDQILMTRFAFDNARQVLKGQSIEGVNELAWKNHGLYAMKGVDEPLEVCEVGEVGLAALRAPDDSEKAHRFSNTEGERAPSPTAPSAASQHVVVSTKTTFPLKPFRSSSFPAGGK